MSNSKKNRSPEEGFSKLQTRANVFESIYIDSETLVMIQNDHYLVLIEGMLNELCRCFQDEVYFNGMKDILRNSKSGGFSGTFNSIKVLAAEVCGYERVVLEDDNCWISFQLSPNSNTMYIFDSGGVLSQLRSLVKDFIEIWNGNSENRKCLETFP